MRLGCLWIRRRIGPYLDRALPEGQVRGVSRHLNGCVRCRQWSYGHERLTALRTYQWVPQSYTHNVWVRGHWSPDGTWIEGHYEARTVSTGYYQQVWMGGRCVQ